jgi:AcrR family transcriptional regulator
MPKEIDTKNKILKTAFELISSSSYDKVSLNDIIEETGVSKGALFHYFDSKYELAKEALMIGMEDLFSRGMENIMKVKSPKKRLKAFIDLNIKIILEKPKLSLYILDLYEESKKKDVDSKFWMNFYIEYMNQIEVLLKDCGIKDTKLKARLLIISLDGLMMQYSIMRDVIEEGELEKMGEILYKMFIKNEKVKRK